MLFLCCLPSLGLVPRSPSLMVFCAKITVRCFALRWSHACCKNECRCSSIAVDTLFYCRNACDAYWIAKAAYQHLLQAAESKMPIPYRQAAWPDGALPGTQPSSDSGIV